MALSKLAVKRLTILANFLHALPRKANEHFDMGSWLWIEHKQGVIKTIPTTKEDLLKCGTSACALGWATAVPSFRKAGLHFDDKGANSYGDVVVKYKRSEDSVTAGERFFNITDGQAARLFGASSRTPKQWAAMCRRFIKKEKLAAK